jgi:hypothetical protein
MWNAALYRALSDEPLLRISVHPGDIEHASIWAQVGRLIAGACASRTPLTYMEWISGERSTAA